MRLSKFRLKVAVALMLLASVGETKAQSSGNTSTFFDAPTQFGYYQDDMLLVFGSFLWGGGINIAIVAALGIIYLIFVAGWLSMRKTVADRGSSAPRMPPPTETRAFQPKNDSRSGCGGLLYSVVYIIVLLFLLAWLYSKFGMGIFGRFYG